MSKSLTQGEIEKILDLALTGGGDFAEVFCEDVVNTTLSVTDKKIENSTIGRGHGVGIRILKGTDYTYVYTNDSSYDNLVNMVKQAVSESQTPGSKIIPLEKLQTIQRHPILTMPQEIAFQRKMDVVRRAIQAGMAYDPVISQMNVLYTDMQQHVLIANTEGRYVEDTRVKSRLYINAYAEDETGIQSGYVGPAALKGFEFFEDLDVESYAREAARIAKTMLGAQYCPAGRMSVVIDNGFGGLVFHEACGHSLEASSVAKGTSEFSGKLGQKIASDLVTLIDDGSMVNEWGSLGVDDEGTPTQKNVLIENGILKSYMVDKLNARRMGVAPTGSGRRQSYRFAPTSRMTNTYIDNGKSTPEEIIANTEKGLFVKYLNAGSVNPATGDFNFATSESYLIENGKITVPVKGATLIGNGGTVLQQVDMVGNNLKIGQGFCFAASGAIVVGAGQPTLRISSMTVGGVEK